jgi:exosortase E/protease (VPEID-CTERM system)
VLLVLLLGAEVVALSIRIDTVALSNKTGWWAVVIGHAGKLASIVAAALAVCTIVAWARSRGGLNGRAESSAANVKSWPFVLAHLAAFGAFAVLSVIVTERDLPSTALLAVCLSAWALAGMAAVGLWCLAGMTGRAWLALIRRGWPVMLAALALGAAAWGVGRLADMAWAPLRQPTFWIVKSSLAALGEQVVCRPADYVLGTERFSVTIASSCSGYEGIGLITVFVGAYLWLFRRRLRFPRAFLILPLAMIVIWLVNAARIAALVLFGTHVSSTIASGAFHSQVGWLGFVAVSLGLVAVTQITPFFSLPAYPSGSAEARRADRTGAYLGPLMALLAVTMVTAAISAGFDRFYPLRVVATATVVGILWRRSIIWARIRDCWSWGAVAIGAAAFAVWLGLDWALGRSQADTTIAKALGDMPAGLAAAWVIFRVVGSVVTVPIAEELAFRGYLMRRLISADFEQVSGRRFTWLSFLASSLLFGTLHGQWLAGTAAGVLYAWAMCRRGRVADAILAHATTNALIAADVLVRGNWHLWA